jgi:hypothetical protein
MGELVRHRAILKTEQSQVLLGCYQILKLHPRNVWLMLVQTLQSLNTFMLGN